MGAIFPSLFIVGTSIIDSLAVSIYLTMFFNEFCEFLFSRLTFNHLERPATYDQIIANPAIQSLPTEVTEHENKIVETVINAVLLEPIE